MPRKRTRYGVDLELETMANRMLAEYRRNLPREQKRKTEYLSPAQLYRRRQREVYPAQGYPEAHLFSGIYSRAYNPDAGKKPGSHRSNN